MGKTVARILAGIAFVLVFDGAFILFLLKLGGDI